MSSQPFASIGPPVAAEYLNVSLQPELLEVIRIFAVVSFVAAGAAPPWVTLRLIEGRRTTAGVETHARARSQ